MSGWGSLPVWMRVDGRPVILLGEGEAADAKRRLLERAGAVVADEEADARLAIVAIEDEGEALAAVERLKRRGVLVNVVDRPDWCDFTVPAIVDRAPVLVAVGTGGVSAGLAATLRQRLEASLPSHLGDLARALSAARDELRETFPDAGERRRAIAAALAPGGAIDPLGPDPDVGFWLADPVDAPMGGLLLIRLTSADPDDLTLRQARALANADRVLHRADVPPAVLSRARADADRITAVAAPVEPAGPGLTVYLEMGG